MSDASAVMDVRKELQRFEDMRRELENMDGIDEQALLDTLEGETDLNECLLALADEIAERDAAAVGLDHYIKTLTDRKVRHERAAEKFRTVILAAMDRAGIKTVPGQRATLSTREIRPGLVIDDESQIPSAYFTPQPPKLDKRAVLADLADAKQVPGARLSNGGISLTIRRN